MHYLPKRLLALSLAVIFSYGLSLLHLQTTSGLKQARPGRNTHSTVRAASPIVFAVRQIPRTIQQGEPRKPCRHNTTAAITDTSRP